MTVRLINHDVSILRAELLDVNINTGMQSINTESLFKNITEQNMIHLFISALRLRLRLKIYMYLQT